MRGVIDMIESMRGLFFIIKGNYTKGVEPSFNNRATGGVQYVGGYDPESEDTKEWYMLVDRETYVCCRTSSDINKVLESVHKTIKKYKGDRNKYVMAVHSVRKASPSMMCLYKEVDRLYGDYFSYEVEEMEDLAYTELKENTPIRKNRKLVSKNKKSVGEFSVTSKKEKVVNTPTPNRLARPKVKIGVKKLRTTE